MPSLGDLTPSSNFLFGRSSVSFPSTRLSLSNLRPFASSLDSRSVWTGSSPTGLVSRSVTLPTCRVRCSHLTGDETTKLTLFALLDPQSAEREIDDCSLSPTKTVFVVSSNACSTRMSSSVTTVSARACPSLPHRSFSSDSLYPSHHSLSRHHKEHPWSMDVNGEEFSVHYWPGDSHSGMFGGNSNWRGPIWLATTFLLIESLQRFYQYHGTQFKMYVSVAQGDTERSLADSLWMVRTSQRVPYW